MSNETTYRIRTTLGDNKPINIPVSLTQEYNSFELLSLKVNVDDTYRSYTSTQGIVIGRVSTKNNGLGIPNVRVSIFVPKGEYNQTDEEEVLYPFSSPNDLNNDRIRYNLLPSTSDVDCYQVVGTFPTKREILDNETVCDVFEKYYKYTTVTNESGDFMLSNIPVGQQRLHIDADLSDIGPYLSQKPYDMMENLGYEKNKFDSNRQFKTSNDIDSLVQVISQDKSVYVYPYWGDSTENGADMKITRTDLSLNYDFKTSAVFMGSVITDRGGNSIIQSCEAKVKCGKMSELVTGSGRIEMIRKTADNKVEQYRIKGDELIDENGVWCYSIPLNLDYVRTDEFGNTIPTDDPNKGVATRARVRFRITINEIEGDAAMHKRCSYLVPNNPKNTDSFLKETDDADYEFGTNTSEESFVDLFLNNVYTVKNYIPRLQSGRSSTNRNHTGIKMVNHSGDNNPFPYNNLTIRLSFVYRFICSLSKAFLTLLGALNNMINILNVPFIALERIFRGGCKIKIFKWRPLGFMCKIADMFLKMIIPCVGITEDFCVLEGQTRHKVYPGCNNPTWKVKMDAKCTQESKEDLKSGGEGFECDRHGVSGKDSSWIEDCIENNLVQDNEVTSFNFTNDWINGCLYMPLWYRRIRPKKKYFFGLFGSRPAQDQWCSSSMPSKASLYFFGTHNRSKKIQIKDYNDINHSYYVAQKTDDCGKKCHKVYNSDSINGGVIVNKDTIYKDSNGNAAKVWYYKPISVKKANDNNVEYKNNKGVNMVSTTLFATDIILIGSLNGCDKNGVPKVFNYLPQTTYNMPNDVVYNMDTFDKNTGNIISSVTLSSGADWGIENEYGYQDGGLFYNISCADKNTRVTIGSIINLSRICEVGVDLDNMQYVEDINSITSIQDEIDYSDERNYLRPDGFISYDDITGTDYRSMFATLNGNDLKTKINKTNGVKEYDFVYLYVDGFDGSLEDRMREAQISKTKANYNKNYNLEKVSKDYLTFRMGENPFYYDSNRMMPKYKNSFYFYFGLKDGKTAINKFNEKYNAKCSTEIAYDDQIKYKFTPNSVCVDGTDDTGTTYDGVVDIDMGEIQVPFSAYLNSTTQTNVTYEVCDINKNKSINDGHIIFYGNGYSEQTLPNRQYLLRDKVNDDGETEKEFCYMLNNGDYTMVVVDNDGGIHNYNISLTPSKLTYETTVSKFKYSNDILLQKYQTYDNIATSGEVIINNNNNTLFVERYDNRDKLNGIIAIYNVEQDNSEIKDLLIEVEASKYFVTEDIKRNREDGSVIIIYESGNEITKQQYEGLTDNEKGKCNVIEYKQNMIKTDSQPSCKSCVINNDGTLTIDDDTDYFHYDKGVYVIKLPHGGLEYNVTISQVCKRGDDVYFKSSNAQRFRCNVQEPQPYKMYINGIDYDIIKNFKTGWELLEKEKLQFSDPIGGTTADKYTPFSGLGDISKAVGWLDLSNMNAGYAWGNDSDRYGSFGSDVANQYKTYFDIKESKKPQYPLSMSMSSFEYDRELEIYNRFNLFWESGYGDEFNTVNANTVKSGEYINENGNVVDLGTIENIIKDENGQIAMKNGHASDADGNAYMDVGGSCGYTYLCIGKGQQYLNRVQFIKDTKNAFYISDRTLGKELTIEIKTDDTPYSVWVLGNTESMSDYDNKYYETDSIEGNNNIRHGWKYHGGEDTEFTTIYVPNISYNGSKEYGVIGDNVRVSNTYKTTYEHVESSITPQDGGKCYSQDNIASSTDGHTVSIKPPYLIACVNRTGISIPSGMTSQQFFGKKTDDVLGIDINAFGEYGKGNIKSGNVEFFQIMFLDKVFEADIVCISMINEIPYFKPYEEYTQTEGHRVTTDGILSGVVNNGVSSSDASKTNTQNVDIKDFAEIKFLDKKGRIITFKQDLQDDIPIRRCIMYNELNNDGSIDIVNAKYVGYKHVNYDNIDVVYDGVYQYIPVRSNGAIACVDSQGNSFSTDIYGKMTISLSNNSLASTEDKKSTLSVRVKGCNENVKYYIFGACITDRKVDGKCLYPINAFDENGKIDCNMNISAWDGGNSSQFFNKNTETANLIGLVDRDIICEEEPMSDDEEAIITYGYGGNGDFTNISQKAYFVVAETTGKCRAISPVYDFTLVFCNFREVKYNNKRYIRCALKNVIDYGTKTSKNYYLAQFGYSIELVSYNADGTENKTHTCEYKKESNKLRIKSYFNKNDANDTYCCYKVNDNLYKYAIKKHIYLPNKDEVVETIINPNTTNDGYELIYEGNYYVEKYDAVYNEQGTVYEDVLKYHQFIVTGRGIISDGVVLENPTGERINDGVYLFDNGDFRQPIKIDILTDGSGMCTFTENEPKYTHVLNGSRYYCYNSDNVMVDVIIGNDDFTIGEHLSSTDTLLPEYFYIKYIDEMIPKYKAYQSNKTLSSTTDPRPHFERFVDFEVDDQEENFKMFVTDVIGLKHECKKINGSFTIKYPN